MKKVTYKKFKLLIFLKNISISVSLCENKQRHSKLIYLNKLSDHQLMALVWNVIF